MANVSAYVDKDATGLKGLVNNSADNAWSGSDNHLPIGKWDNIYVGPEETYRTRSLVHFNIPFGTNWSSITSAVMHIRQRPRAAGSNRHGNPASGTSLSVVVRRMVRDWWEGDNNGEYLFTTQDNLGYDRKCAEIAPSGAANWVSGGEVTYNFTQSDDAWEEIDITQIVTAWFNNFKGTRNDAPNYGVILINGDEDTKDKAFDFYSRQSSNDPYLVVTYATTTEPPPPTGDGDSPDATIGSPTNGGTVTTLAPTITWSYSDPNSLAQESARIRIYKVNNGDLVHENRSYGTLEEYDVPGTVLADGVTYDVEVKVRNTDLVSDPSPDVNRFTVSIATSNPSPTNLSASADELRGVILLSWTAPSISGGHSFAYYNIYRKRTTDVRWEVLDTVDTVTTTTYEDWTAGMGISYDYRVTVVTTVT